MAVDTVGRSDTPTRIGDELVEPLKIEENMPGKMVVSQCPNQSIRRRWIDPGELHGTQCRWSKGWIMEDLIDVRCRRGNGW